MFVAAVARPPAPTPTPTPAQTALTARPVPSASASADRDVPAACAADVRGRSFSRGTLEERVRELGSWVRANPGGAASLVLTDEVLTESVRAQLAGPDAPPFEDPRVAIRPDGIHVSGAVSQLFFRFPISARLVPAVSGGVLRFEVRDLDTGNLPSGYRDQVQRVLGEASDPANWRVPLRVDTFVTRSGCAVLAGRA